jgi:hypothetical protein
MGKPIGNMDLLIASHAVSQDMTLVTNNIGLLPVRDIEFWSRRILSRDSETIRLNVSTDYKASAVG